MERGFGGIADTPRLLLIALVVVIGLTLIASGITSSSAFDPYNMGWDGTSELRSTADEAELDVTIGRETMAYDSVSPHQTVAFVLAPDEQYDEEEVARISEFLENGGRVVIGTERKSKTNRLLRQLGVSARVGTHTLRDEKEYYKSPELPLAEPAEGHAFTEDVDIISMNIGTTVTPNDATVIARSSEFAYIDSNENGELETNERVERVPVAVVESVGDGEVIVTGDSSIFINSMIDRTGNRRFTQNLMSERNMMLLDVSHAAMIPPLVKGWLIIKDSSILQAILLSVGVVLISVWSERSRIGQLLTATNMGFGTKSANEAEEPPETLETQAYVEYLESTHPDWDSERIERVVKETKRKRGKPITND